VSGGEIAADRAQLQRSHHALHAAPLKTCPDAEGELRRPDRRPGSRLPCVVRHRL